MQNTKFKMQTAKDAKDAKSAKDAKIKVEADHQDGLSVLGTHLDRIDY